jgi:hypothetical protein
MALRFLADHCVSNSTIQTIREANHDLGMGERACFQLTHNF